MVTIYDLLEVSEDASKEEIERAYSKLVLEFRQDINFDSEKNKENEIIVNKLKMAYEILTDDEKRKKYDYQLAEKRAESLLENVSVTQEEKVETEKIEVNKDEKKIGQDVNSTEIQNREVMTKSNEEDFEEDEDMLSEEERKRIKKAAQKEFKNKLKKVKQANEAYNDAYNRAYAKYMRKMGYDVEEEWSIKRIIKAVIAVFVIIIICIILWYIPPIQNKLINLYEENFVIKGLVDIIKFIIKNIIQIFKS